MKKCQQCNTDNPLAAKFCHECGSPFQQEQNGANKQPAKASAPGGRSDSPKKAERRQVTFLFCDLVESTALSERLDPEEYRQVIYGYQKVAEEVIDRFGGYVGNYLGDGLLVYFGYPKGLEDAAKVSIETAMAILQSIQKANEGWSSEGRPTVNVRIGIHTGLAVVDEHLALGDTVNIAARLEGLAPINGIVISPMTFKLTEGWFEVNSLGEHQLKGISAPMEIFEVVGKTGARSRLQVAKSKGLSPLVGRSKNLDSFREQWQDVQKGSGKTILLTGEAGIGKSRLVDTIQEEFSSGQDIISLEGRCSAYHKNSAFYPIIELLEDHVLKFSHDDEPSEKWTKLKKFLSETGLDANVDDLLIAEFLFIHAEEIPRLNLSPFAKRQRSMECLTRIFKGMARDHCLLFVIEDLHWIDASTLEWISKFISQITDHKICLLCTTRPVFQPDWKELPNIQYINLDRLSPEDIEEICTHQSYGKPLPGEIIQQIIEKTEGIPLFVEELTKMIIESNMVIEHKEGFAVADSISSLSIPSTLQDSLLARLDRLKNVKEVVQVGAVLGRAFTREMLEAMMPPDETPLAESIPVLIESEIFEQQMEADEHVYQFKHALIMDTAYDSMLRSERQLLHLRAANTLNEDFKEVVQLQPEVLAHHFMHSNEPAKAIPVWLQAGQLANQKNASFEALSHLKTGLSLLKHLDSEDERNQLELDFMLTLGGTYVVTHGFPHPIVKETFDKAREIAQKIEVSPKLALILFNLLSYYFNTEDFTAADALNAHVLNLAKDSEYGYFFKLAGHQLGAIVYVIKGNYTDSAKSYRLVLEVFDPAIPFPWELAPSGYIEIGAKAWLACCLYAMGEFEEANALHENHLSFAEHHHDAMSLYHIHTFLGLHCLQNREWKQAVRYLADYFPIVREYGDPVFNLTAEVYDHIAKAFLGSREDFENAKQKLNFCMQIGFNAFASATLSWICELHLQYDELDAGLEYVDQALKRVNASGSHIHTAELFRVRGLILQELGHPDSVVEENFQNAINLAREQSSRTFELRASVDLAKLKNKKGESEEGYQLLKGIYDWFPKTVEHKDLEEAQTVLEQLKN